jgi:cytochrome c-type biogenesis protein CcmE
MSDPRRQRRLWYIVGGIIVVGFLAYGATSFKSYLTPYVSFEQAQKSGSKVQVAGKLVPGSPRYVKEEQALRFALADDDGNTLVVVYTDERPSNFEDATQVVAVGEFRDGAFHAENLLVKCPSKYQGIEEDPRSHG